MRFRDILRTSVLLLTISLVAVSCITVDKSLGSENIPNDHILKVMTATFQLPMELKMSDSIQSTSSSSYTIGAINTSEFGMAKFGTAANLCPFYSGLRFGEDPKVNEVYLSITRSATQAFTDNQAGIIQGINVYRLTKYLDTTDIYNNSLTPNDYMPTPLNIGTAVFSSKDSVIIALNNSLGEDILNASNEELDTLSLFQKNIRGLYITCDTPPKDIIGGRINQVSFGSAILYISYNFKPTWDKSLPRKDTLIGLYVGYNYCLNTSSYSSKNLETNKPLKFLPIEGIGGIKPYINTSALKDTLDNWMEKMGYDKTKVLISRATVTLPFELPTNLNEMDYYPKYLYPCHRVKNTTSSTTYYLPFDEVDVEGNERGIINRSLLNYSGDISPTIQYIINKDKNNIDSSYDIFILPLSESTSTVGYSSTTVYVVDYLNYYIGKINGPLSNNPPTLSILYSVYK